MARARIAVPVLLASGLAFGCLGAFGGTASADATYEAVANSTGLRVIFTNQSVPLGVSPKVEGPVAQARQTSLRQSDAYAAFPYPGDEVAGLPGIVASAAGVPFQAPAYPFSVNTTYGDDLKQLSYPGIELRSESGETVTQASATGGSGGLGASSSARIARDGDAVSARSRSDADVIRLGDTLVISGLRATADAARDTAGALTRSAHLSFTRLQIPGLALKLPSLEGVGGPAASPDVAAPDIGFADGQFTVTLPGTEPKVTPVPTADVLAAFAAAGYKTTYQAAKNTKNGIIGAGLEFTTTLPAPPPATPAGLSGETPVTFQIGFARAEVAYAVEKAAGAVSAPGTNPGTTPAGTLPAVARGTLVGSVDAATVPPSTLPPSTVPSGESAFVPELTPDAGLAPPAPGAATVAPGAAPFSTPLDLTGLAATRAAIGNDVGWIYLMLVAVAGSAFAATFLLRYRGVRTR